MKNKTYLISLLMTQLHFEMTWLNNIVRLAAVSWECRIQEAASEHLLLPCYTTKLDEQDPTENKLNCYWTLSIPVRKHFLFADSPLSCLVNNTIPNVVFCCLLSVLFRLLFILIIFKYNFTAYLFIIFSLRLGRKLI